MYTMKLALQQPIVYAFSMYLDQSKCRFDHLVCMEFCSVNPEISFQGWVSTYPYAHCSNRVTSSALWPPRRCTESLIQRRLQSSSEWRFASALYESDFWSASYRAFCRGKRRASVSSVGSNRVTSSALWPPWRCTESSIQRRLQSSIE